MTSPEATRRTAAADQVAATLRDRRGGHHGQTCDALDPCDSCKVGRRAVTRTRALARIPEQRQAIRA